MTHEPILRDSLTGAYLRSYFQERLNEEIERHSRLNSSLALAVIDLDHFKSINDAFGHARGDQVLIEFAHRVQGMIRAYDLLFRYGGDEFVLLLPNADKPSALTFAQRILDAIQGEPITGEPPIHLTLSMGVAIFPNDAATGAGLFERADARAYQAKHQGRGRVVIQDTGLDPQTQPSFEYSSRLLEREPALGALNGFLDALPEFKRGLFLVSAPHGAGRSRFLLEVGQAARLRGYAVLSLFGNAGRRTRIFGVFSELTPEWESLPSPGMGQAAFINALKEHLINKGQAGFFVLVDDVVNLDPASLDFLENLMSSPASPSNALVCSGEASELEYWRRVETPLREEVSFRQLSEEGARLWLRGALRWEAPESFHAWLYAATSGLPGHLKRGLKYLVEEGVLIRTAQGWNLTESYLTQPLKNFLDEPGGSPAHNLPITLSLFVGREDELRQIKRRLDHQQLVTLVGQGGMGKTRLSIQAAAELRNEFYHGVVFIPLADIGASELIVSVIAQALRFDFHGQRDPRQQLLDYLRAKKMLLVFDNFEHLLDDGTGLVTEILQEAPQVKLLVTSREQLGLPGESVIELRGLSYPPAHALYADHYSAVQLLQLRAQKKANAPAVTEADHPYVTRICQLVDGLPLGIELAAAWTSTFTYQEIAAEIERNVRFLEDSGRQHGLRAVFEYLWNALLVEEQAVLCKLSLFHGGFRLDAARHIAGAAPFFISALFDKACLVKISANRYALPEVFRQYAEEKFSVRPEAHADAIGSHGRFFMFFLGKLSSELEGIQQPQYLTMISEEISNVRVAWLWAVHGRYLPELQQGLFTLFQYYDIKSLYREGLEMFGQAIEMLGNIETETGEESRGLLLGRLFAYRGTLAARLRLHIPARDDLEKARTIFNELGTSADKAFVVLQLGLLANTFSELDLANTELHTALRLYRDANMQMGTAHALAGLGLNAWSQTRLLDGREHVQQALELYETLGNEREQASMLNLLGNIAWDLGEYQNGQQYYEGSLALSRKLANSSRIAMSLNNLGYTQYLLGQYKLAAQFLLESLKIWEALGDRAGEALSLNNLGFLAYLQENYDQAEVYNRHSLDLRLVLGNIQEIAFSKYVMALVLTARGKYVQARRLSEEALAIFRSQNNPITSANVIAHLAHLAALEENWEQAGLLGTDALTLSRSAGEPHSIIHALNIVGAMQILQQESESARILLIEALGLALPINWAPEILEILGLLGETLQLTGDHEQAARILILVVEHPASSARTRTQAQTHLDRLQPKFDPMDWDVMYKSARDENLENLARRLLQTYTRP